MEPKAIKSILDYYSEPAFLHKVNPSISYGDSHNTMHTNTFNIDLQNQISIVTIIAEVTRDYELNKYTDKYSNMPLINYMCSHRPNIGRIPSQPLEIS